MRDIKACNTHYFYYTLLLVWLLGVTFSAVAAQAKVSDQSGKLAKGIFTPTKSHRGYLERMAYTLDYKAMSSVLQNAKASYRYFTLKGNGVRVRQGASTKYKVHYVLNESAAKKKNKGAILGGIIGNRTIKGDKNCSGWYEILALHVNEKNALQSSLSEHSHAEYICKDYVKVQKKNPFVTDFLKTYFNFIPIKSKTVSRAIQLQKNIQLLPGTTGAFLHSPAVTLKKGDTIAFLPKKHGVAGLAPHLVPICRHIDKTYALYVGALSKYGIEKTLGLNKQRDRTTLRNWLNKYFK